MEMLLFVALVAIMMLLVARAAQNRRVMVRVPARISQPRMRRRR